jgi:hypothetical protein
MHTPLQPSTSETRAGRLSNDFVLFRAGELNERSERTVLGSQAHNSIKKRLHQQCAETRGGFLNFNRAAEREQVHTACNIIFLYYFILNQGTKIGSINARYAHWLGHHNLIFLGDALKVALESYRFNKTKIQQCDCWIQRHLSQFQSRAELTNSPNALATMGAGLPSAMMAAMLFPQRHVLAVCGDGGFMMNSQEMETAVRLGLNLVVLIIQDNPYGMIRWKQVADVFADWGLSFGNPDFVATSAGCVIRARLLARSGRTLPRRRRLRWLARRTHRPERDVRG